uniref:XK-related protein n=1 Tax=Paramormyrops kingsleyae TaxID=1676925 RepID=A0A3B3RYR8_9TELE|nr:XK-related protein 9 [Paramormyrops kingsleyae]XP_023650164.1 XK-related protein 9 [Paramormyrops kingsleyae]
MRFTKFRWFRTVAGLVLYVADIIADVWVAGQYFSNGNFVWGSLTLLFVLNGFVCSQVFSYAWFCDDLAAVTSTGRNCRLSLVVLHVLQLGIFTRYQQHLKMACRVLWTKEYDWYDEDELHLQLFGQAADLSMLRLFETFLESAPQLVLQLYVVLGHDQRSIIQYISIVGSFFNIAWATVDYWRCFRRSMPNLSEMPPGAALLVYLLYKLLMVCARVLTLSMLLLFSTYCLAVLLLLWLLGFLWTLVVQTDFCTSKGLEWFYRAVVAFILIFTFFNIKGQNTKVPMTVYYAMSALQNLLVPLMFFFLTPAAEKLDFFWQTVVVIAAGTIMGLLFLSLYYSFLHPRREARIADVVDGPEARIADVEDGPEARIADVVDGPEARIADVEDGPEGRQGVSLGWTLRMRMFLQP